MLLHSVCTAIRNVGRLSLQFSVQVCCPSKIAHVLYWRYKDGKPDPVKYMELRNQPPFFLAKVVNLRDIPA